MPKVKQIKTDTNTLKFKKLNDNAILPLRSTSGSSGYDLSSIHDAIIHPKGYCEISTGLSVEIPENYVGLICPRSGSAKKAQVGIVNSPGTIDSDYRGEIIVLLENRGTEVFQVSTEQRIAQMTIVPYFSGTSEFVEELSNTNRNENGFGSTGK